MIRRLKGRMVRRRYRTPVGCGCEAWAAYNDGRETGKAYGRTEVLREHERRHWELIQLVRTSKTLLRVMTRERERSGAFYSLNETTEETRLRAAVDAAELPRSKQINASWPPDPPERRR